MSTPFDHVTEPAPCPATCRARAASDLQRVDEVSLPAAVARVLQLGAQGMGAKDVSFWRYAGDGKSVRLFCKSGPRGPAQASGPLRLDVASSLRQLMFTDGLSTYRRNTDREFAALAISLELSPGTGAVHVLPVRLLGSTHGLLVVEMNDTGETEPGVESFLQLVAARLEIAYLADPGSKRGTALNNADDTLRQSHLSLNHAGLKSLFYFAPTAMILTEVGQARPIAANRHALELFRISDESTTGTRTTQFWDDLEDREHFIGLVMSRGFVRGHRARLRRADGSTFWARVSATAIDYDGQPSMISSITDVSDIVAAEEVLNRTQQTLATLLETSPFPLVVTRLDTGVVRYCNRKAADMFETPLSGLLGHTAPEFYVNPADRTLFVEKLRDTGRVEGFVAQLKTRSGEPFWAILSAKTLELNDEPVFMVAFADVTRQKNKEAELESLAFRDGLTDAYNRRYFIDAAEKELARSRRSEKYPVMALLDIDHFKHVNDTWGHDTGDEVLREFASIVGSQLRKADILARYGGEEFAVLFPETGLDAARDILERIQVATRSRHFAKARADVSVTFSSGIVRAAAGTDYASFIRRADLALYAAKRAGRNCIEVAPDDPAEIARGVAQP